MTPSSATRRLPPFAIPVAVPYGVAELRLAAGATLLRREPAYWAPQAALAVYELLDDLHGRIWNHYQIQLSEIVPEDGHPDIGDLCNATVEEPAAIIECAIPADWTAMQAAAVFGLLDSLREQVWDSYKVEMTELIRNQRRAEPDEPTGITLDDLPF